MGHPAFGHTRHGLPVHRLAADHLPDHSAYARLNKRVALGITRAVGSMGCAYVFCLLSLLSLPAVLTQAFRVHWFPAWLVAVGLIALVAWIAQTFLQLVLLSVIMVGQNVQQAASDARAAKTFEDTEILVNLLDPRTPGGLAAVLDEVRRAVTAAESAREEIKGLGVIAGGAKPAPRRGATELRKTGGGKPDDPAPAPPPVKPEGMGSRIAPKTRRDKT